MPLLLAGREVHDTYPAGILQTNTSPAINAGTNPTVLASLVFCFGLLAAFAECLAATMLSKSSSILSGLPSCGTAECIAEALDRGLVSARCLT